MRELCLELAALAGTLMAQHGALKVNAVGGESWLGR